MSHSHRPVPKGERGGGGVHAVVGLQWGDEGKGKIVDLLTPRFDAVVRFNGGANAGHTVVVNGDRYALHLVPSGILHGKQSVIGPGVVVDPEQLLKEIAGLEARGIDTSGLVVSDRAHVVMPYHAEEDARREAALGSSAIGTTKRGIGPAYADKVCRSTALRMGDLIREDVMQERIRAIVDAKTRHGGHEGLDAEGLIATARRWAAELRHRVRDTTSMLHGLLGQGRGVLIEGANATLLDVDHGTYPYVTSSNASALGICAGTGLPPRSIGSVLGVFKAYCTRVGGGPFPTEIEGPIGGRIRERGREYGTTTGRPRRVGWLDLVALRYAATINGVESMAIMLLDVLGGIDELRLCTGYRIGGEVVDWFPSHVSDLESAEPIFETVPRFEDIAQGASGWDVLPAGARAYVGRIEEFVGVGVSIVSVGPGREQTIEREAVFA